jgi:hypothetical protein
MHTLLGQDPAHQQAVQLVSGRCSVMPAGCTRGQFRLSTCNVCVLFVCRPALRSTQHAISSKKSTSPELTEMHACMHACYYSQGRICMHYMHYLPGLSIRSSDAHPCM